MKSDLPETPLKGRVAGIDYGTVRVGVAISDYDRILASPYEIYHRKNENADAKYFQKFVEEERIVLFVVGLPLHLDGRMSDKAREATDFGSWLTERTGIECVYFDERFTSVEAERFLLEANFTRKKRKARLDKIAAQILLKAYLESGCRNTIESLPIDDEIDRRS